MVRRREEIRMAVLNLKAHVKRAGESGEEVRENQRHYREAARRKCGEEEKPEADGLAEESFHAHVARWNRIRQPSALITRNGTIAN